MRIDLKQSLSSIPAYEDGIFVSKWREVKKKFVDVIKKPGGAVMYKEAAGKPGGSSRFQWLVRDVLDCTGRGNCQRECGGLGCCIGELSTIFYI
jgi:hypothetical protein